MGGRVRIERFDPASIRPHRKLLFVGRSGGGKSVAMRAILRHLAPRIDLALCFSPTEESVAAFRRMVPGACVYQGGLDLDVVARALALQRELGAAGKERALLIVADDCSFEKQVWRDGRVRDLLMNGRHQRITTVLSCQYMLDLPPDCRTQIDYVFCTNEPIHANKKRLHQAFFGLFRRYDDFDATLTATTADFSLCVLDQTQPTPTVENSVFWYRAALRLPPFTIGRSAYWKLERRAAAAPPSQRVVVAPARRRTLVDAI